MVKYFVYIYIFFIFFFSTNIYSAEKLVDSIKSSDVTKNIGLPQFHNNDLFYWFTPFTTIVCKVKISETDKCFLDKSIKEIEEQMGVINSRHKMYFLKKKINE